MTEAKLRKRMNLLEKRVQKLENHINHPPHILKVMEHLEQVKIVTLEQLRDKFRGLWSGGSLSRLYDSLRKDPRFRVIHGQGRWADTFFVYFGNDVNIASDKTLMAVDYFQRIPKARLVTALTSTGKRTKAYRGKQGTIKGIMRVYGVDEEKALQAWEEIFYLFKNRIIPARHIKRFRRKY